MLPDAVAFTLRFNALGSLEQSGKALLFAVRHASTLPLLFRNPDTATSSELSAAAKAATAVVKATKPKIGTTSLVPKPKV